MISPKDLGSMRVAKEIAFAFYHSVREPKEHLESIQLRVVAIRLQYLERETRYSRIIGGLGSYGELFAGWGTFRSIAY